MKRSTLVILFLLAAMLAPITVCAQWVALNASHIQGGSKTPLANGNLCVFPVDQYNHAILNARAGATGGGVGGGLISEQACGAVTNGVLASGFSIPDTTHAWPVNLCIRITITDSNANGKPVWMTPCAQTATDGSQAWCSGTGTSTVCNLDDYSPAISGALALQVTGPPGPTGPAGPAGPAGAGVGTGVANSIATYTGTMAVQGFPFTGAYFNGSNWSAGFEGSGAPGLTCDVAHLYTSYFDVANSDAHYICIAPTGGTAYAWTQMGGSGAGSGYAVLAAANTFTTGNQKIQTGAYNIPGLEVDGTAMSSGAPVTIVGQGNTAGLGCCSSITTTAGNALLVIRASTSTVPAPTDNWGDTFTVLTTDTSWYNSNGGMPLTYYLATNIHGGLTTMNGLAGAWGSLGEDEVYELSSLNAVSPLDVMVVPSASNVSNDTPNPFTVTTTGPNETLFAVMIGGCGPTNTPVSTPTLSWTLFPGASGTVTNIYTTQAATAGTYSINWTWGCGNYRDVLALRGGSIVQTANLITAKDVGGHANWFVDGNAHANFAYCSSGNPYPRYDGTCGNPATLGGTARTCNSNGCYRISADGTIEEWGQVTPGNTTATAYALPYTFAHACDVAIATANNGGGNPMYDSVGASCSTTQITVQASNSSLTVGWHVIGY